MGNKIIAQAHLGRYEARVEKSEYKAVLHINSRDEVSIEVTYEFLMILEKLINDALDNWGETI